MRVTWLYTGADGRSHFADLDLPMSPAAFGRSSPAIPTTDLVLRETPGTNGLHTAPRRQLVIYLAGVTEVVCGDCATRRFRPGDVLLADDTTGEGHVTRDVEGSRITAQVGIPDDLDLSQWLVKGD